MTGLLDALNSALADLDTEARDQAAVELARTYAAVLDDADEIETGRGERFDKTWKADVVAQYGPLLQSILVELQLTPRSRAALAPGKGPTGAERPRTALDELRDRRSARLDGAAPVDTAPS